MDKMHWFVIFGLLGFLAYFAYRDFLYRQAFKALGVADLPNLQREMTTMKVALTRMEEHVEDMAYKGHGLQRDVGELNKQLRKVKGQC